MDSEIENLSIFYGFNANQLRLLRPLFTLFFYPAGSRLFEQGEHADYFYILIDGSIAIHYKPEDGPILTVTHIRPEGVAGWSAAIGNPWYTSSAVCTCNSCTLRVSRASLRQFVQSNPTIGSIFLERLAALIEARLESKHPQLMALLEQGLSVELDQKAIDG
jgi:CRP/FNR family cyclic AMP-dependent transcriptional regulator